MMFLELMTSVQTWALLFVLLVGAVAGAVIVCEVGERLEHLKDARKDDGESDD